MAKDILYLLRRFHGWLSERKTGHALRKDYQARFREKQRKNPRTVYLILTPEHSNLGDHAIASAEIKLLNSMNIDYVEITGHQLQLLKAYHVLNLMNGKPIFINGGGNLGTLWVNCEKLHREIFTKNPSSPIFVMPNTIFYEDSSWGQEEYAKSIVLYNRHKNLYLYAREENSYRVMKQAYKNVKLIPDMVLSLDEYQRDFNRKGCLLCLRSDREKSITDEQEKILQADVATMFGQDVRRTDTVLSEDVPVSQRQQVLEEKLAEFARAQLVITDRLHGMIFCAITGTPCIVINSKSPKVLGCFEWIKGLGYIRLAANPEQVAEEYMNMPKGPHKFDNSHLEFYYQELREDIRNKLGWR